MRERGREGGGVYILRHAAASSLVGADRAERDTES